MGLGGRQQWEVDAAGPRMDERVVEGIDVGGQHARTVGVTATQQPQLLLLADMREIPHQRTHQRVVLPVQFVVVEVDQGERAATGGGQVAGQRLAFGHPSPLASWVTAVASPYLITRSENASPGQLP